MISVAALRAALPTTLLSVSFICAASPIRWLEREGDGMRLYFGEFDEYLREASPDCSTG